MSEVVKKFIVNSASFGRDIGVFYVKKENENFTVYNKVGDNLGRYNSEATAVKIAENFAYKRLQTLKVRINGLAKEDLSSIMDSIDYIDKHKGTMIGGFYIINSCPSSKVFHMLYENDIKFIYPSYKAAFADLIVLHKAKDFEVLMSE